MSLSAYKGKTYPYGGKISFGRKSEMDLLVREAQPADAEALAGILNPIIAAGVYTVLDTPLTAETERQFILNFPPRGVLHVAVRHRDHKVVGFQSLEPFATYTHAFDHVGVVGTYVDLSCRRQGIGTCLFQATFEAARRKGYEKLFTFVRADNSAALATYLKQGFYIVGTALRQAKFNGRYVDEVIIERFL
jgi:L-amino acid N-acyltransferase YncA